MRNILNINRDWVFVKDLAQVPGRLPQNGEMIHLPHTWKVTVQ